MDTVQPKSESAGCFIFGFSRLLLFTSFSMFLVFSVSSLTHSSREINVAVLVPFSNEYLFSYRRVAPAISLAIEELNKNASLLRNHDIRIRFRNSQCSIAEGMAKAIDFFMKSQMDVLFGPICDYAAAPVARQMKFWNIPMISLGTIAHDFFDKHKVTYPLLTRVGPINLHQLSELIIMKSTQYQWKRLKFLYSETGQDYIMMKFCRHVVEFLINLMPTSNGRLKGDYVRIMENSTSKTNEEMLLNEVGLNYAIVVLCASPESVREIMIKAHELNFDNGEYVFFNIDLFTSKDQSERPWYRENDTQERNEKAKKAYEAVMTVTVRKPTSPKYKRFSDTVKKKAEEEYNFTYGEEEVNSFVGAFHDAVILYALALNESLEAGVALTNGSEITRRMWNRTFDGITGKVSIDDNGDRSADYSLLDMDPATEMFQVVANYYGNNKQYEPVAGRSIAWAGGRTEAPPDTPKCGFDGSKCPPDVIQAGQSCKGNTDKCVVGASCDNDICKCQTEYVTKGNACSKKVTTLGGTCTVLDTCTSGGSTCDEYAGKCLLLADESCKDNQDKCITGATCSSSNLCNCSASYSKADDKTCAPVPGKVGCACNAGGTCNDSNAECSTSSCICKTGYRLKPTDATCEKNVAALRVLGSSLTVVLFALMSQLL